MIYNLYQLHIEINKQGNISSDDRDNVDGKDGDKNQSVMHSNYFGFEHKLQKWLVNSYDFHFLNSDITALFKLYNMMICSKSQQAIHNKFNIIFILCIMIKIIFHNTELHIVKINKVKEMNKNQKINKNKISEIKQIFLNNLNNIIIFTQCIIEKEYNDNQAMNEHFSTFKILLTNFKILPMIKNILHWFAKASNNKKLFHICRGNPFLIDISSAYLQLFGLKHKFYPSSTTLDDQIAIWV